MLRKISSSEKRQTLSESKRGSDLNSLFLLVAGLSQRVRSCRVRGWLSEVSFPF